MGLPHDKHEVTLLILQGTLKRYAHSHCANRQGPCQACKGLSCVTRIVSLLISKAHVELSGNSHVISTKSPCRSPRPVSILGLSLDKHEVTLTIGKARADPTCDSTPCAELLCRKARVERVGDYCAPCAQSPCRSARLIPIPQGALA
ncbi:hypothetical protein ACE6H2_010946 [Prunus campanulata]